MPDVMSCGSDVDRRRLAAVEAQRGCSCPKLFTAEDREGKQIPNTLKPANVF